MVFLLSIMISISKTCEKSHYKVVSRLYYNCIKLFMINGIGG